VTVAPRSSLGPLRDTRTAKEGSQAADGTRPTETVAASALSLVCVSLKRFPSPDFPPAPPPAGDTGLEAVAGATMKSTSTPSVSGANLHQGGQIAWSEGQARRL
jgi:hypothetical protein